MAAEKRVTDKRKRKPKILAVINDACTGCAGSPVCVELCPVDDCMLLVPNESAPVFNRIWVDPYKCIGCKLCISKGTLRGHPNMYTDGCPWDAIDMVDTPEWEKSNFALEF